MTMKTAHLYSGSHTTMKVGLCQVYTEPWAVEENLKRTIGSIQDAACHGADIAITPECVLQGYPDMDTDEKRRKLRGIAEPIDGQHLRAVCEMAAACAVNVVVGFALFENEHIYNAAALISTTGAVVNVYRKVHLRSFEDARQQGCFTAGDEFMTARLALGDTEVTAGTMICFDREIPESTRCLRSMGAEFVTCPLATNTSDMKQYINYADNEMITRCRAAENELYIAVVNHAGRFNGGSFIVGPTGELVAQMGSGAGVDVIEIPVGVAAKGFHSDPLGWMGWGYRKRDVYRKYLF